MLFSSPFFVFIYLPLFLGLFFITKKKYRNYVLLLGSISFYFWGEPVFCIVAILSCLLDYVLGKKIQKLSLMKEKAKLYVTLGVVANLLILVYYKYFNFFVKSLLQILPHGKIHFDLLDIMLPIGVSFIVFEKITYLVDIYRGIGRPAASILQYLNYVFLFPKLLAGPIIKYHEIEHQLADRAYSIDEFAEGFKRFIRGLLKKVLIADTCAEIANPIFGLPQGALSFHYAWLGIAAFTLQIYFDFSGYSDMALGLARMLGFKLRENFNLPYISSSFTDFWRRWHISLSTWIKEYLYIPLGGNQKSVNRMYINLWICFLLSGLWHGANWTFVLWGAYNGLFLVLDKLFWLRLSEKFPLFLRASVTLFLVMLGWVIFRSSNFDQMLNYLKVMFNPWAVSDAYVDVTSDITLALVVGSFLSLVALVPGYDKLSGYYRVWSLRLHFEGFIFGALGFFALCKIVGVSFNPFLYFRF